MRRLWRSIPVRVGFFCLVAAVVFSTYMLTRATTPNPGHPWAQVGDGVFAVANTQTGVRTFTFPDASANILTSSSSASFLVRTVTVSTTLSATTDTVVLVDASSGPITITLPSPTGTNAGLVFEIKKIDSSLTNQVTVQATATVDGIASISFANRGEGALFQSDGSLWRTNLRRSYDFDAFHTRGTTANQLYTSPNIGSALITTNKLTANQLYAMPLVLTKTSTIDEMAIRIATASGTLAELGIYSDNGNEYPGALMVDCGSVSPGSTGVKTTTTGLPLTLDAGLYWMVIDANAGPTPYQFAVAGLMPIIGYDASIPANAQFGWYVSQTAGALPGTFPGSGTAITAITNPIPAIFVRFSG